MISEVLVLNFVAGMALVAGTIGFLFLRNLFLRIAGAFLALVGLLVLLR